MSKVIEMIIREHYEKGANRIMEKGRTLAFQVSEELFQRVKEYLENYEKAYHNLYIKRTLNILMVNIGLNRAGLAASDRGNDFICLKVCLWIQLNGYAACLRKQNEGTDAGRYRAEKLSPLTIIKEPEAQTQSR